MGYLVLEFDFSKNRLMSIKVFAEMESAMEYVKEEIHYIVITSAESMDTGGYVMLDSADENDNPTYPYYVFDVDDCETKKHFKRYEVIKLVDKSCIGLW